MRSLKTCLALFLLLGITTTVRAQSVSVDYDHRANFSGYKTFMWINRPHYRPDPIMDQRLMDAVNAALTAKGWQLVTEGADVGVAVHIATRQKHTLETFYDGFGGGWGWHLGPGFGTAITTAQTYELGTVIVDLFDTRTKQLIWRGVAIDTLSEKPEKDTKKIEKAIDKVFKDFPPR
ncbi:MAG TPA: DUF4136 domain-containing protein [Candidatus Acidoferrales bacterium]|nr:DUF4136 domain-containing protein [Candidatus Acidoferrales bacterium]